MGASGHAAGLNPFKVKITAKDNPIMNGVTDFETADELYAKLQGDAPIEVLATGDSDWSHKTEPLVFTLTYGQGRVFHETFGHTGNAIKNPQVAKIIVQGCAWAAGKAGIGCINAICCLRNGWFNRYSILKRSPPSVFFALLACTGV